MSTNSIESDNTPDPVHSPDDQTGQPRPNRTNLLEHWAEDPAEMVAPLQSVRLDSNEVIVVPFSPEVASVQLHYCDEPEIRGYVACNGPGCSLCRAGRNVEEKVLLPVYQPATRSIAVLPIGPNSRPGALRPQIMPVLRSGLRVALSIRKPDRATFVVSAIELKAGMDDGSRAIAAFTRSWDGGKVNLASIYPRLANRDLAAIPGISTILTFKGISPDDIDRG